jgi:hypothetical protein
VKKATRVRWVKPARSVRQGRLGQLVLQGQQARADLKGPKAPKATQAILDPTRPPQLAALSLPVARTHRKTPSGSACPFWAFPVGPNHEYPPIGRVVREHNDPQPVPIFRLSRIDLIRPGSIRSRIESDLCSITRFGG